MMRPSPNSLVPRRQKALQHYGGVAERGEGEKEVIQKVVRAMNLTYYPAKRGGRVTKTSEGEEIERMSEVRLYKVAI